MGGLLQTLESIDTVKLTGHLQVANGTVSVSGSASIGGLDPRDMLGEFGTLLKSANPLAINPDELAKHFGSALTELEGLLHIPAAGAVGDVAAAFDRLVKLLEDVAGKFGGSPDELIDKLLSGSGGLEKILSDLSDRVLQGLPLSIPAEIEGVLKSFRSLADMEHSDPAQLAGLLSNFFIGLDIQALSAPADHLTGFLDSIRKAGGDFGAVDVAMENLTAQARVVSSLMLAENLDLATIENELNKIRGGMDVFFNSTLAGAIAKLNSDLTQLDPDQLAARLRQLLAPIEARVAGVGFDLVEDMVKPIQQFEKAVDALTPEMVTGIFAGLVQDIRESADLSVFDGLFDSIDGIFDSIIAEIERVPLRELRMQLLSAMATVEGKIREFPGLTLPEALTKQIQAIEGAIDKIDLSAIQNKVAEFAGKINDAANQFPIQDIKGEIEKLIDSVRQALDQFKPLLAELKQEIDSAADQIGKIDFDQAGQASIGLVHEIREKVQEAAGSADVPEPVKMAIGEAASLLRGIDVKAEVSGKFNEQLDKIDPKIALAPLDPILKKFREVMEKVTPQALIDQLDKPFEALLKELDKLKPAALLAGLTQEFDAFGAVIGKLDPKTLVAPLEAEFQKLVKAFQDALDPAPLFAPLRAAYQKLQELLDFIDLEKLFRSLMDKLSGLPDQMQDHVGKSVSKAVTGARDIAQQTIREFRFGDMVRILAALINKVKSIVTGLAEHLIGEAFNLLDKPLSVLTRLAAGGGSLLKDVTGVLSERMGELDVFASSLRAVEFRASLEEMVHISASLPADGQARIGPLVASVQLEAHVSATVGPAASLNKTASGLRGRLAPPDIVVALTNLGSTLGNLVPGPLLEANVDAAVADRINALFSALDLDPLADEMDRAGRQIQAKMTTLMSQVAEGVVNLFSAFIEIAENFMPIGILKRFQVGMDRIRAEFTVLDPAVIEAEVRELIAAVVSVMNEYSPAAIAGQLSGITDAIKGKLQALNPATLLGSLDPIGAVIANFEQLRPSIVLKPLADSTKDLTDALENIIPPDLTASLVTAAEKLKAELEVVVEGVAQELQSLLEFLESLSGGSASVSVSVSA